MTIFELLEENGCSRNSLVFDEEGNLYLYYQEDTGMCRSWDYVYDFLTELGEYSNGGEYIFVKKEIVDKVKKLQIEIEDEVADWSTYVRRPYYRMRGRRVTEEQASEIIRRTDHFFRNFQFPDYIGSVNFDNWLIQKNHIPQGYGWIHRNGVVGTNTITQKYPCVEELVREALDLAFAFPYLKLMVGITNWDEMPDEWWEMDWDERDRLKPEYSDYTAQYLEAMDVGLEISEGTIRVLGKKSAVKKYQEYAKLYEEKNTDIYVPYYYLDHNIVQVDEPYLRSLIEYYGVNYEEAIKKCASYEWPGRKP